MIHDALQAGGVQAARVASLWWVFFWVCVAAYAIVIGLVLKAILTRRAAREERGPDPAIRTHDAKLTRVVGVTIAVTALLLFALMIGDYVTRGRLSSLERERPISVRVVGHQWWWEFQISDSLPSLQVTTANELHLPVGRAVRFELRSADVIHSFWVPSLLGKKDAIPGRSIPVTARADKPGVYVGQCAEYCGLQHATMRFLIVAEPEADYRAWLAEQRRPAAVPATESQRHGQSVFLSSSCIMCHSIQGTPAGARMGPDLTHLMDRRTIAAATLSNTRAHLERWIEDPQSLRPGVRMPLHSLTAQDVNALLDYLQSLR